MRPDILSVLKNSDSRFVRDLLGELSMPIQVLAVTFLKRNVLNFVSTYPVFVTRRLFSI